MLRQLIVKFDTQLAPQQLSAFRGAIAHKVGLEYDLFHNHDNSKADSDAFHYRYPLIHYHLDEAGKPFLVCFNEGVEELQVFFAQADWTISLNGAPVSLRIADMQLYEHQPQQAETLAYTYQIKNWQALNQAAFAEFRSLSPEARIGFLEKKLVNAILTFGRGVGWHFEQTVKTEIVGHYRRNDGKVHHTTINTYTLTFRSNTRLPFFIGLGKGVAQGFGFLTPVKRNPSGQHRKTIADADILG